MIASKAKSSVYKHIHADSLPNINHLPAPSTMLALVQNPLSTKGKRLNTLRNDIIGKKYPT